MKPTPLRVTAVTIRDVLGARELALEPGRITRLEGRNASGKTTILQAVQAALGRGSLAKLARIDSTGVETEPEVVLALEGDGEVYRVERTGEKVRVRRRVGETAGLEDVPRPQEFLAGLFDAAAASPVRFLTAPDKDRVTLLLEALPLKLDRAALLMEMAVAAAELPPLPAGLHPLEELTLIRDAVFRARTGVNRDAKGKAAAAEQTRRNAPATVPEDLSAEVGTLDSATSLQAVALARDEAQADATECQAIADAEAAAQLEAERVSGSFKAWAARTRKEHEARAAEIRAEAERRVAEDLGQVEASIETRRVADEAALDEVSRASADVAAKARDARAAARQATESRKVDLQASRERLAALRAQVEASAKARALHEQAAQFDREAEQLETEGIRLTAALDALDTHRRRLAEDLPIAGLTIDDGVIRVNGVPFEQLNTAERVKIAVQVATLRARAQRLPLVFVDGAEALDAEHFERLVAELQAHGIQAFVAAVRDHDLEVRTE